MRVDRTIRLSETVLADLDLSLWAGPCADEAAISRALDWEAEVAKESELPSVGLLMTVRSDSTEALRAMLGALALSRNLDLSVVLRFCDGIPDAEALDPRKVRDDSAGSLPSLFENLGIARQVEISDQADPMEDLRMLAARCDYVGILRPGCWMQPRGGFALFNFLAKEKPDLLVAGSVSFDPLRGDRIGVNRVPANPRFAVLGGDVLGPCPILRASSWESVSVVMEVEQKNWWRSGCASWAFGGAAITVPGLELRRLRLHIWGMFEGAEEVASNIPREFFDFLTKLAPRLGAGQLEILPSDQGTDVLPFPQAETGIGVVIPFLDQRESTLATLRSLAAQTVADRIHVVLVDNGSSPELLEDLVSEASGLFAGEKVFPLRMDGPFNFARLNNRGEELLPPECGILVFSNNDIEMTDPEDLGRLCGCLSWKGVGLVGGRLVFPDGEIQAAGFRMGAAGPQAVRSSAEGALRFREVDGVSFALAVCRREIFRDIGGLDEKRCPNGFGDALFCHLVRSLGWRILCVPRVVVRHFESKSRGVRPEEAEFLDLCDAGLHTGVHFEDYSIVEGVRNERFRRPAPSMGKRVYRSVKAFLREWRMN